jgi:hypothetical protein
METILGDTLIRDGALAAYYSPPFRRGGEAAVFSIEMTVRHGACTLVMEVEHRNIEDSSWSSVGNVSVNALGAVTLDLSGLKEEIRFKFTFSAGALGNFVQIFLPAPMWLPF